MKLAGLSSLTSYKLLQTHDSDIAHLKKRLRVSDEKRLAAYEGNLVIEMVKGLSNTHNVESEIRGNDPEASKKKLVGAAETHISMFGTAKKVNSHTKETEEDVDLRWRPQLVSCLSIWTL